MFLLIPYDYSIYKFSINKKIRYFLLLIISVVFILLFSFNVERFFLKKENIYSFNQQMNSDIIDLESIDNSLNKNPDNIILYNIIWYSIYHNI